MQAVVDGTLVYYEVINPEKKKSVLVLHGWGHEVSLWRSAVEQVSPEWSYVLLDLPGFGKSSFLPGIADVPEYAGFIEKFMAKIDLENPVILGHSFGGQIGLKIAIDSPTLLTKLLLVSPAGIRKRTIKQQLKVWVFSNFSILKKILPDRLNERLIQYVSTTDYFSSSKQHRDILKLITQHDLLERLDEIKIPVKIFWGDEDKAIPYMGKKMVELIDEAELYVMYGEGHNPHIENPLELGRYLNIGLEIR